MRKQTRLKLCINLQIFQNVLLQKDKKMNRQIPVVRPTFNILVIVRPLHHKYNFEQQ